jgi:hypothetical protein
MRIRLLFTAVASLSLAAAGSAEPPKAPVQKAEQPAGQQPIVVAAADEAPQAGADDPQASTPAKPARHARVTSCRCGDQNPGN